MGEGPTAVGISVGGGPTCALSSGLSALTWNGEGPSSGIGLGTLERRVGGGPSSLSWRLAAAGGGGEGGSEGGEGVRDEREGGEGGREGGRGGREGGREGGEGGREGGRGGRREGGREGGREEKGDNGAVMGYVCVCLSRLVWQLLFPRCSSREEHWAPAQ